MSKWSRWAPLCGVAFVACLVVSFILSGNAPDPKASGAKVISFYVAHKGEQQGAAFLGMYAIIFFLFFAAALRGYMRRLNAESGTLAALSLVGGALLVAGGGIMSGTQFALSDVPSHLSPGAAQALNVLNEDLFIPLVAGACVFLVANGLAVIRHRVLPVWLGWVALLFAVASVTPLGFIGFLATMGWVLFVSLYLVVVGEREPAPTGAPVLTAG